MVRLVLEEVRATLEPQDCLVTRDLQAIQVKLDLPEH